MLKLGSWLWTRPTCWIRWTLCIDMVVAFLAQDINYSGDSYWNGLAIHLSNLCYGMLQEGQCILHVGWISQSDSMKTMILVILVFLWKHSKHIPSSTPSPLHTSTPSTLTRTWTLLEKAFPVSFYQLYGWVWSISITLWRAKHFKHLSVKQCKHLSELHNWHVSEYYKWELNK